MVLEEMVFVGFVYQDTLVVAIQRNSHSCPTVRRDVG